MRLGKSRVIRGMLAAFLSRVFCLPACCLGMKVKHSYNTPMKAQGREDV
jgi:hypothetical protein